MAIAWKIGLVERRICLGSRRVAVAAGDCEREAAKREKIAASIECAALALDVQTAPHRALPHEKRRLPIKLVA